MTAEISGYCSVLEAPPGTDVRVMVSTTANQFRLGLAKASASGGTDELSHALEPVGGVDEQILAGKVQHCRAGSYGWVDAIVTPAGTDTLTISAVIWPTLADLGRSQTVIELTAEGLMFALELSPEGWLRAVAGASGDDRTIVTAGQLHSRYWYLVEATLDAKTGTLRATTLPIDSPVPGDAQVDATVPLDHAVMLPTELAMTLAGRRSADGLRRVNADGFYNGKIDTPLLRVGSVEPSLAAQRLPHTDIDDEGSVIARWNLGADPAGVTFADASGHGYHGEFVNAPMRAVTGYRWKGDCLDFNFDAVNYRAVYFHDDDLEDASWECSAVVSLPADLSSGMYAVTLSCDGAEDHIPVFVVPAVGAPRAKVAFLTPTFTYLAYANGRLADEVDYEGSGLTNRTVVLCERERQVRQHLEYGSSTYDLHTDGSGVCYSSHLRPVLTMRNDHRSAIQDAPRHFAADLALTTWLDSLGAGYDVLTDHGLHARGYDEIKDYTVLITGSHPEYWSSRMLDAAEEYKAAGGSIMYLGANGFYWVTSASKDRPHLIEIRRGTSAIRSWESDPGELYHSQSGEMGSLWRYRGRSPNKLVGIGMTSQGWDTKAPGFARTEHAMDPRAKFIFNGIDDELIGDFGLVMGGASGDELDRADPALGTPRHALTVATSEPHSKYYLLATEEMRLPTPMITGENNPKVRSDITFLQTPAGGAVFSVGSITWAGSLAYNNFDNNVARMTENVLRDFLHRNVEK
ncbi:N,N-dimethylformamidase beta subunit family domain-containing protein [Antricoccus suffuscus]|uniref:N,N-dimethylformamidase beta subunit family domain-containing protein n=1 Tax=Antricoccus suffuscus TaxID=1629062 RepID=UPI0011B22CCF|nr:N,N-dimethylformamidase beta subunit family domain-containing protein [Antricoccus suffuscus]